MFLLSSLLDLLVATWMFLFQMAPTPTPIPVTIVSQKHFWPETFVEWAGTVSALAIILGGIWALRTYREGLRFKAAEMLLNVEQEFRIILPTYELIENPGVYRDKIVPMLAALEDESKLSDEHLKLLADLDRCLRFLFLCSVLNQDLAVEQNVLLRAYHHYVDILAEMADEDTTKTPELASYVRKFYPTLCRWTDKNQVLLAGYRLADSDASDADSTASVSGGDEGERMKQPKS